MKPPRQFRQLSQTTILTVRVFRAAHTDENHPGAVHSGVKAYKKKPLNFNGFRSGGDSWTRTNDPIDVNDVL